MIHKEALKNSGIPNWRDYLLCKTPEDIDRVVDRARQHMSDAKAQGMIEAIWKPDELTIANADAAKAAIR